MEFGEGARLVFKRIFGVCDHIGVHESNIGHMGGHVAHS